MKNELVTYINYRLEKAREALDMAKLMFPRSLSGTVNRLYYACFYCVIAALLIEGKSTRRHATAVLLFQDTFTRKGLLPAEMGKFFSRIFDLRIKGDYADLIEFDEPGVKPLIDQTEQFVQYVSGYVLNRLKEGEQ